MRYYSTNLQMKGTKFYLDEPEIIDPSLKQENDIKETDNIQVYAPLNLNQKAILRRLQYVIAQYGAATKENEKAYADEVNRLAKQILIYESAWQWKYLQEGKPLDNRAVDLAHKFIHLLEEIPIQEAESFPVETIINLRHQFGDEEYNDADSEEDPTPGFSLGWRMGLIREENDLTKSAMAKSLGISPSTWGSYENDASFPSEKTIEKFCMLYHINRKWLLTNRGPIYRTESKHKG